MEGRDEGGMFYAGTHFSGKYLLYKKIRAGMIAGLLVWTRWNSLCDAKPITDYDYQSFRTSLDIGYGEGSGGHGWHKVGK